jgi:uncharacterized membrane protein
VVTSLSGDVSHKRIQMNLELARLEQAIERTNRLINSHDGNHPHMEAWKGRLDRQTSHYRILNLKW